MTEQLLYCALSLAAQCIVSGPVCLQRAGVVCLWVCYHEKCLKKLIRLKLTVRATVIDVKLQISFYQDS